MNVVRTVTIRDLRNHGGRVLDDVAGGEPVLVTRDGTPVAELRPLPRRRLSAGEIVARWRGMPDVDPVGLRADIDEVLDASL